MAIPTTRTELIDYCLRALGAPVIEINVDDEQLEDRVDEALQFYQEYHADAVTRTFLKHQVTQENIDTKTVELPDAVISVIRLLNITNTVSNNFMFDVKYQMHMNDLYSLGRGKGDSNLLNYTMNKEYLGLMEHVLGRNSQQVNYARHQNTLQILNDWETLIAPGEYLILECYQVIDPEAYGEVYNDMALKKYLTALIKKQWGINLIKFGGMQLPGGVTLNGTEIYERAVNEITALEESWDSRYQTPVDFYIG